MNENSATTRRKSNPNDFRDERIPTEKARESSLLKSAKRLNPTIIESWWFYLAAEYATEYAAELAALNPVLV